jgi:transposase-like protein/IS1 family transposase
MNKTDANMPQKMDARSQFCPNLECKSRGQIGQKNIVIHAKSRPRYRCKTCGKTFSATTGTVLEGLRKPTALILIVIVLLAYGCPIQAIVHAFGLDERTIADWRDRAGKHCEIVHKDQVERGDIDLQHVQADEIRVKARGSILWMGLAIMISTRLWIAGDVSKTRDRHLTDRLMQKVRGCCKSLSVLLICTDGFAAYPKSILRAFREKAKRTTGKGRCSLHVWPHIQIGTVIKRTVKMRLKEIVRQVTYGTEEMVQYLLVLSRGGNMLNTSYIERFNGTMRERLASLTRKCRHASAKIEAFHAGMYLIGCTYNFCFAHHELSKSIAKGGFGRPCTPAMATGITDHIWSVLELITYKVPPAPFPVSKKRGRPRTKTLPNASLPKKPRGRPRKEAVCATTI